MESYQFPGKGSRVNIGDWGSIIMLLKKSRLHAKLYILFDTINIYKLLKYFDNTYW